MGYHLRRHLPGDPDVPPTPDAQEDDLLPPGSEALDAEGNLRLPSRRRRAARRTVAILPSACTLANMLCGFLAIFVASRPVGDANLPWEWTPLTMAAVFVFMGMVFDAFDGHLARLTRSVSDIGEQLDSLADMVTFGIAPAFLAVQLVGVQVPYLSLSDGADRFIDRLALVIAGTYAACAALRLARFNTDLTRGIGQSHTSFRGLPSPGAAGTVASLVLLHQHYLADYTRVQAATPDAVMPWTIVASAFAMVAVMLLVAFAMVSRIPYPHFMNKFIRGRTPVATFAAGLAVVLLMATKPQITLATAFLAYAISAPVISFYRLVFRRPAPATGPAK